VNDTLEVGESHPCASGAIEYIKQNMSPMHVESIASSALSGNRTAEVCLGTYNRLLKNEPVSDRYVLGLAWLIMELHEFPLTPKAEPLDSLLDVLLDKSTMIEA